MNYPLISEYIEAIKSAEDNFEELSYLRPVLGDDGLPVMTSGNFAVVFKMKDGQNGKYYAVKCFTKEQEGRTEAYREIAKELENVSSPYILSIQYLEKELFVDTDQTTETEFPVLLMDWVEGKTLDKYLRENLDDKYALEMLAYRFSLLAQWLIPQPFAHGDLKPDNILVRDDGTLVLVDYDGMYVPAMKGQKARELGSPDFRHPQWSEDEFNNHIDDFPLISILLSLKAISINYQWLEEFGAVDRLLLSKDDYLNFYNTLIVKTLLESDNNNLNVYLNLFSIILSRRAYLTIFKNQIIVNWTILNKPPRAVISKVYKTKDFGMSHPFVHVIYKKNLNDQQGYEAIYNVTKYIENKEQPNIGSAYDIFCMRMPIGGYKDINLFDIPLKEVIGNKTIREISTLRIVKTIPIATYKNREDAVIRAKQQLGKLLKDGIWGFVYFTTVSESDYEDCYTDDDNVIYSKDRKKILSCADTTRYHYVVNDGCEVICDDAFCGMCQMLESVDLPHSLKAIGKNAFSGCYIQSIALPKSVVEIGDGAFSANPFLFDIYIPNSVQHIGKGLFEGCNNFRIAIHPGTRKKFELLLPEYKNHLVERDYVLEVPDFDL